MAVHNCPDKKLEKYLTRINNEHFEGKLIITFPDKEDLPLALHPSTMPQIAYRVESEEDLPREIGLARVPYFSLSDKKFIKEQLIPALKVMIEEYIKE